MKIETLYNIGDEVWCCRPESNYSPRGFVVRSIKVQILIGLDPTIQYSDYPLDDGSWVHERYLFFTRGGAEESRAKKDTDQ